MSASQACFLQFFNADFDGVAHFVTLMPTPSFLLRSLLPGDKEFVA